MQIHTFAATTIMVAMSLMVSVIDAQAQGEATCPCDFLANASSVSSSGHVGCWTDHLYNGQFGSQIDGAYGAVLAGKASNGITVATRETHPKNESYVQRDYILYDNRAGSNPLCAINQYKVSPRNGNYRNIRRGAIAPTSVMSDAEWNKCLEELEQLPDLLGGTRWAAGDYIAQSGLGYTYGCKDDGSGYLVEPCDGTDLPDDCDVCEVAEDSCDPSNTLTVHGTAAQSSIQLRIDHNYDWVTGTLDR